MISIAVVDDERQEREQLQKYYVKLQTEISEELDIHVFSSGEELLENYQYAFDLICLDIDMNGRDGIETAKEIRKLDADVIIMFITNMAQMAIHGYEVQALDFVIKPVNYYSFSMKMQSAFRIIEQKKSRNIVINTTGGIRKISTNDLLYAEVDKHYLFYHTKEGVFRQKVSLKELEDKLVGLSFKRCNNCYLINLKHVECVDKDDVKVGDDWLKISRPRKKEFLQALANYMGGTGI